MANQNKQTYPIRTITYVRRPTGEVYPADFKPTYLAGKRVYGDSEMTNEKIINSTWGAEKQKIFNKSKKDNKVSVHWRPRQVVSVTKEFADGRKETTSYKPVRNNIELHE